MKIQEISLKNFLSYEDTKLNLIDTKEYKTPNLFIIDGINYDNIDESNNNSNGSGKSSLIAETIFYNIYGKGLRGNKGKIKLDDIIKYDATKMENSVKYIIENNNDLNSELEITREKSCNKVGNTDIKLDGEEKTKRTKKLSDNDIKMFMDLTPEVFSQSIIYYRDNDNLFKLSYSQRLEFFKKMIDITIIDTYYDKIKSFKYDNEKEIEKLKLNKQNTEDIISIVVEKNDDYINFIKNRISEINIKLENAKSVKVIDIKDYNNVLDELKTIYKDEETKETKIKSQIIYNQNNIDKINKEISKFNKLSNINCPTCNQMVSNEYSETIIKEYQNQLSNLENENLNLNKNRETINSNIKEINSKITFMQNKINDINTQNRLRERDIEIANNELIKANKDLDNAIKKQAENDNNKIDKNKYEIKLTEIVNELNKRNNWQKMIDYWYDVLSPKSILRSSILKKYIDILSDMLDYYLNKLYNTDIHGEIVIDDNSNIDLKINYNGNETGYYNLSSGERRRIDLGLLLALRQFISNVTSNPPQFLILDEPLDNLDNNGIHCFMKTIAEIQIETGIDVYIISHIDVPIQFIKNSGQINVKKILVSKINGASTAKFI